MARQSWSLALPPQGVARLGSAPNVGGAMGPWWVCVMACPAPAGGAAGRSGGQDDGGAKATAAPGPPPRDLAVRRDGDRRPISTTLGSRAARDVALARRALRRGRCERPRHLGDAGVGDRQAGAARAHPRVAAARLPGRVRGHRPPVRQGGLARRCAGSFREVPRRWPRRCLDRDRRDPWSPADDRRRDRAADLAGRAHRDHRAGGRQPLRGARDGGRLPADESDGVLDGEARALLFLRRWTMRAVVAAALLVASQARAADEAARAEETKVAQITPAALPPVASVPKYGAPASLPPVTAQLFRLGGMLEVQPMFAFSIGDPFWRTLGMGVRVEHHFDERWSISGHAIGGISLLSAPVEVCSDTCNSPAEGKLRSTPGKLQ